MVPRTGSHHMRLAPQPHAFCPGVAPLVRRGFLLAAGRGPRQPKALASGDAGATDCEPLYRRSKGGTSFAACARPHDLLIYQQVRLSLHLVRRTALSTAPLATEVQKPASALEAAGIDKEPARMRAARKVRMACSV